MKSLFQSLPESNHHKMCGHSPHYTFSIDCSPDQCLNTSVRLWTGKACQVRAQGLVRTWRAGGSL